MSYERGISNVEKNTHGESTGIKALHSGKQLLELAQAKMLCHKPQQSESSGTSIPWGSNEKHVLHP